MALPFGPCSGIFTEYIPKKNLVNSPIVPAVFDPKSLEIRTALTAPGFKARVIDDPSVQVSEVDASSNLTRVHCTHERIYVAETLDHHQPAPVCLSL